MRYFKFAFVGLVAAIALSNRCGAQSVAPDFAASARTRVNYYRAMAKLPPIAEDNALAAGALNHAKYLIDNGVVGGDIVLDEGQMRFDAPQDAFRVELKGKPSYTDDGASAGRYAVVIAAPKIDISGAEFIDRLMTMPFDGLIPMVPQLSTAGLGAYCGPGRCVIVIPYRFALEKSVRIALYDGPASDRMWNPHLGPIPAEQGRLVAPVEFPPDGSTVNLQSYTGKDFPDPLLACPDYKTPTGAPISIQLGEGYGPDSSLEVSSQSVTREGVPVDTCLITAASLRVTNVVKLGLGQIGAAVILPREPLAPGHYKVELIEAGKLYQWSFTVVAPAAPAQSAARQPIRTG
jgi:hypothetical protein